MTLRPAQLMTFLAASLVQGQVATPQPAARRAAPLPPASAAPLAKPENAEALRSILDHSTRPKDVGPLATDRPGFADTTSVVPRGYLQFELGYTYTADQGAAGRTRDHAVAQSNLRIGMFDNLELRFLWSGFSFAQSDTMEESRAGRHIRLRNHEDGAGDATVGFRTQLLRNDGLKPDLTLLVNLALPVGAAEKSAGDVVPDIRLAYGWALTDKLRLYGVGIAAAQVGEDDRFLQTAASAGLSYAWNERLSSFIEYYGIYPAAADADCAHSADGGFSILLKDNLQLDFSAGVGLNEAAPDWFVACGLAIRF